MPVEVCWQIAQLLEHGVDIQGETHTLAEVANATGITYQTLANLVSGKSTNPRLKTLQALCCVYGISLDYFSCETEQICLDYLTQHRLQAASPVMHEITRAYDTLSAKGQRNVLTILEWMRVAQQGENR
jgi:transcriptional regulator with XRE-family HTH domain